MTVKIFLMEDGGVLINASGKQRAMRKMALFLYVLNWKVLTGIGGFPELSTLR